MVKIDEEQVELDIHKYEEKVIRYKKRFGTVKQGDLGIRFLDKLYLTGLSYARIIVYADRLSIVLEQFNKRTIDISKATKQDCEDILSEILQLKSQKGKQYGGQSKRAFALTLLRLVHYAKTQEIGNRDSDDGYVSEVSWIKPSRYEDKKRTIKPEELLTVDEVKAIIQKATTVMDIAMIWTMFEGAFRPGEMLNLRVGGIEFRDNYVLISTYGKTGNKRVPLVMSFRPLMNWLAVHPKRDNPLAYLWYSSCTEHNGIGYETLRQTIKKCARDAQIKKRVWNYLFRHTKLTHLSKTISDRILCVFGNWSPESKMPAKYSHLSGKDVEDALLEAYGIKAEKDDTKIELVPCPRCTKSNTPDSRRCNDCGFILDENLLIQVSSDQSQMQDVTERLSKIEKMGEKMDLFLDSLVNQKPVTTAL